MKITALLALLSSSGVIAQDASMSIPSAADFAEWDAFESSSMSMLNVAGNFESFVKPDEDSAMTASASALKTKSAKADTSSAKAGKSEGKSSKATTTTSSTTTSSTTTSSTTTSSTTTPCVGFCRRRLEEGEDAVKEDVRLERRLEIIEGMKNRGAKPDATFSFVYDLISQESCDALVKFIDEALASAMECSASTGVGLPVGTATGGAEIMFEEWLPFTGGTSNQYNRKLYVDELVPLIGSEETLKIIDFFEESLGNLTIDCLYLARHGWNGKDPYLVPWHNDDYATMEITLNDNYEGGHVLHMNSDGVHKTDARPGSATAHTVDIVHGITPNIGGPKYMLIAKHHFNRPDKEGVVRLSKEMVNAIEISA